MRWVDQATTRPMRCAVLPYVGNGSGHAFLDTGQDLDLEHVYVSDVACEEIARLVGWQPPQVVQEAHQELAELRGRVGELEAKLEAAEEFQAHVDGLARHGLGLKKLPGRKPKKEEAPA